MCKEINSLLEVCRFSYRGAFFCCCFLSAKIERCSVIFGKMKKQRIDLYVTFLQMLHVRDTKQNSYFVRQHPHSITNFEFSIQTDIFLWLWSGTRYKLFKQTIRLESFLSRLLRTISYSASNAWKHSSRLGYRCIEGWQYPKVYSIKSYWSTAR